MITMKRRLEEMTLEEFIAISKVIEYELIEEKTTDQKMELLKAHADFLGVSTDRIAIMDVEEYREIVEQVNLVAVVVLEDYKKLIQRQLFKRSFECALNSPYEKRKAGKKYLFIVPDIKMLPTGIHIDLKDHDIAMLQKYQKENKFYKEWQLIPHILSKVCWRKGEKFTTKVGNHIRINYHRINQMKEVFLQVSAEDAIKVFAFFLVNWHVYTKSQGLKSSKPKSKTKNSGPLKRVKNLVKGQVINGGFGKR